jgi:hypothetical protein
MNLLLVIILFCGMAFWFAHLQKKMMVDDKIQTRVEYRYLPLSIDQWFKESQYAASDVMNSMVEDTNGYCGPGGGGGGPLEEGEEEETATPTTDPPMFMETDMNDVSFV